MTERVRVGFANREGAVVRILGAAERRGYALTALAMREGELTLDLTARDPSRRLDVLAAQLRRLHDVSSVTCQPAPVPSTASAER